MSQLSQLSQPQITLPVTASLECRSACPSVPTVPTVPSHLTSAVKNYITLCNIFATFRPCASTSPCSFKQKYLSHTCNQRHIFCILLYRSTKKELPCSPAERS